jgi:hypothetical protein
MSYLTELKRNDLILVDQTCSHYTLTRQDDARLHTFLVQADVKGIKWLYYLPYNRRREELYLAYYRYTVREETELFLYISNYPILRFTK